MSTSKSINIDNNLDNKEIDTIINKVTHSEFLSTNKYNIEKLKKISISNKTEFKQVMIPFHSWLEQLKVLNHTPDELIFSIYTRNEDTTIIIYLQCCKCKLYVPKYIRNLEIPRQEYGNSTEVIIQDINSIYNIKETYTTIFHNILNNTVTLNIAGYKGIEQAFLNHLANLMIKYNEKSDHRNVYYYFRDLKILDIISLVKIHLSKISKDNDNVETSKKTEIHLKLEALERDKNKLTAFQSRSISATDDNRVMQHDLFVKFFNSLEQLINLLNTI